MNNLSQIDTTFEYLKNVYELTRLNLVKGKLIKSGTYQGLNLNSLVKYKLLSERQNQYIWGGVVPHYSNAYDYYHLVRKSKKNYHKLMDVLEHPETYSPDEILEAIYVKGETDKSINGKNENLLGEMEEELLNVLTLEREIEEHPNTLFAPRIEVIKQPVTPTVYSDEGSTLNAVEKLMDKLAQFQEENLVIRELLTSMISETMVNGKSQTSTQKSISKIIAIVKTNQDNLYDVSLSQYYLLKERYVELNELAKIDVRYVERRDIIVDAMKNMRKRIDANIALTNRYGN